MTGIYTRAPRCQALFTALLLALLGLAEAATARDARLKFGTLVPEGSLYHQVLQDMGDTWRRSAGQGARFSIYAGGTQGGEHAMVQRMRIGQLDGAMLSSVGLDAIEPEVSALQFLPMAFRDWDEFDHVAGALRPGFEARLLERGFVVLLWGEAGWVQWYTKAPATRPAEFRNLRLFGWGGSPKSLEVYKEMGFTPVALETGDILPALQTGLLDAVPMPAFYALAGQFDRVAPHLLDMRWAPIVGAAVITQRAWKRLGDDDRAALRAGAAEAVQRLHARRDTVHAESVAAMQARGLSVHRPDAAALEEWHALVREAYPRLRGTLVPAETFDRVFELLAARRR